MTWNYEPKYIRTARGYHAVAGGSLGGAEGGFGWLGERKLQRSSKGRLIVGINGTAKQHRTR